MANRSVLTIATGKKLYVDMAINLARSFILWNKDTGINFYLATDLPQHLPADVKGFVKIITLQPDELGKGFSPKLHLDKLAPAGQTLFIDSDCLVYGNLLRVFDQFKGCPVSVIGTQTATGEWFGDVAAVCKKFNVASLPKFNGGVYYLEQGDTAKTIYKTARELETQYDEIGFVRLRGRPNDEVVMALALALHRQQIVPEDGSIMAEFVNFKSGIKSDLLNGVAELYNHPANANYQPNWHLQIAKPLIVHFLGHHNSVLPYTKEASILKHIFAAAHTPASAKISTWLQVTLPAQTGTFFRNLFRPLYRIIAGTRKVKPSERLIQ